jgi:uncharacterized Fe-S cluster-containing protein
VIAQWATGSPLLSGLQEQFTCFDKLLKTMEHLELNLFSPAHYRACVFSGCNLNAMEELQGALIIHALRRCDWVEPCFANCAKRLQRAARNTSKVGTHTNLVLLINDLNKQNLVISMENAMTSLFPAIAACIGRPNALQWKRSVDNAHAMLGGLPETQPAILQRPLHLPACTSFKIDPRVTAPDFYRPSNPLPMLYLDEPTWRASIITVFGGDEDSIYTNVRHAAVMNKQSARSHDLRCRGYITFSNTASQNKTSARGRTRKVPPPPPIARQCRTTIPRSWSKQFYSIDHALGDAVVVLRSDVAAMVLSRQEAREARAAAKKLLKQAKRQQLEAGNAAWRSLGQNFADAFTAGGRAAVCALATKLLRSGDGAALRGFQEIHEADPSFRVLYAVGGCHLVFQVAKQVADVQLQVVALAKEAGGLDAVRKVGGVDTVHWLVAIQQVQEVQLQVVALAKEAGGLDAVYKVGGLNTVYWVVATQQVQEVQLQVVALAKEAGGLDAVRKVGSVKTVL